MKLRFTLSLLILSGCVQAKAPALLHTEPLLTDQTVKKAKETEVIQNPDGSITVNAKVVHYDGSESTCVMVLEQRPSFAKKVPVMRSSTCAPQTEDAQDGAK